MNGVSSNSDLQPFGQGGTQAEGSGFVLDADGHIVTNAHVVEGASTITVRFSNGDEAEATLVGTDPSSDIAVLKVDPGATTLHPLELGTSKDLVVGQGVVAIGSPFGLQGSVTTGIVSALDRSIQAPNGYTIGGAIQTDAAINHGNSGGPLLDSSGKVVGVNAQIASDSGGNDGVGFAIPSDTVSSVAQQLIAGQSVEHAYLGVSVTTLDSATARAVRRPGRRRGDERRRRHPGGDRGPAGGERVDERRRRHAGRRRHRGRRPGGAVGRRPDGGHLVPRAGRHR